MTKQKVTLSIVGMIGGFLFALLSAFRYYVIWTDIDRLIAYTCIGILITCVSWLYNRTVELNNTIEGIEDYLDELEHENHKEEYDKFVEEQSP